MYNEIKKIIFVVKKIKHLDMDNDSSNLESKNCSSHSAFANRLQNREIKLMKTPWFPFFSNWRIGSATLKLVNSKLFYYNGIGKIKTTHMMKIAWK